MILFPNLLIIGDENMNKSNHGLNGKIIMVMKEICEKISMFMLGTITIVLFAQIVLRNFTSNGLVWGNELSVYLNIWLVFLGATIIFADNKHVSMDFIMARFGEKVNRVVNIFNQLLIMIFIVCVLYNTLIFLIENKGKTPVMSLPYFWFYFPLFLSMSFMVIIAIFQLIDLIKGDKK